MTSTTIVQQIYRKRQDNKQDKKSKCQLQLTTDEQEQMSELLFRQNFALIHALMILVLLFMSTFSYLESFS
jgi:hypothetical protein